ncbi:DUF2793 domain-containing protein [Aestuariivirga sp.]|uniref:DUF2793 domain-containing protein n=1 Tax=Aestuariivirga sp. TaxID=2650926 RepID=UPI0039E4619D
MSDTPLLGLPYLAAAQAQKHVTQNEALSLLDGLVQGGVKSRQLAAPPAAPANGDRYVVAANATGAWAGATGKLAFFCDGDWRLLTPREGWRLWIDDEDLLIAFDGTGWRATVIVPPPPPPPQTLERLGINATADATNRLAVAARATLLNHDGTSHQLKVNKATSADTASLLFQTGYSGRAEMGTTGSDSFRIKVSADGSTFTDALSADAATGTLTAHQSLRLAARAADPAAPLDGEVWYSSTAGKFRKRENGATSDLVSAAAAVTPATLRASLAADVTLLLANVFYDGVQLDLAAGTWLIVATSHFMRPTANASVVALRVTDGTNVLGMISQSAPSTLNWLTGLQTVQVVTLAAPQTVRLQMAATLGSNGVMKASFPANGTGPATTLAATRLG